MIMGQADFQQQMANLARAHSRHFERFREIFGRNLKDFWDPQIGNMVGVDTLKLDDEVIKSADDESVADATTRQFGFEAAVMVCDLIGADIPEGLLSEPVESK